MKYNGSDKKPNHKYTDREIAKRLWILLDDIDTASDMFKPPKNAFYQYVMKKAKKRFELIGSDGYDLIFPN